MQALDRMRDLVRQLCADAAPDQRAELLQALDDPALREWTYLPGDRPGLSLERMTAGQQELAFALMDAAGAVGDGVAATVAEVVEVERARRRLAAGGAGKPIGPDKYWFRVLGDPAGDAPWGWRVNGHHLGIHVVAVGDRFTVTPHFFGAEPAQVLTGPDTGLRPLGPDEDLARACLAALAEDLRREAVHDDEPPRDILTRHDPMADTTLLPDGVRRDQMAPAAQRLLDQLVRRYLARTPPEHAARWWDDLTGAGLEELRFGWAGGTEPGQRHYYCVHGHGLLIEYDNTQDGGNHAHSVLRHAVHDWGIDLLREHYLAQHGSGHQQGGTRRKEQA